MAYEILNKTYLNDLFPAGGGEVYRLHIWPKSTFFFCGVTVFFSAFVDIYAHAYVSLYLRFDVTDT